MMKSNHSFIKENGLEFKNSKLSQSHAYNFLLYMLCKFRIDNVVINNYFSFHMNLWRFRVNFDNRNRFIAYILI